MPSFWSTAPIVVAAALVPLVAVRRRRALVAVGIGLAVGAAAVRVLVAVGRSRTLDGLPPDSDPSAAGTVYDTLTDVLSTASWAVLALGLALALGAWPAGRVAARRRA
ncbi:hypothetical protein N4G70_28275 [Streptomyces sp. ASQP_92]|uniref:hypothetical protein n=1 Tax=Streptomyces sp. ASQP_92 TaxID=2979116 RepID=UPI0021C12A29|nr:hypothetical protein [Streptomyces sp. ASQP_92]MCT9092736.1 hypothetical protein [Streptomyces sp. ASQP_92]